MAKGSSIKAVRVLHLYFGVFISPAILFFALTGALQTFGLHEPNRAGTYQPPKWLAVLGHLHKKADASVPPQRPPAGAARGVGPTTGSPAGNPVVVGGRVPEASAGKEPGSKTQAQAAAPVNGKTGSAAPGKAPKQHNTLPLKIFFAVVSLGLFSSTFTGLYMSYTYHRNKGIVTAALVAGIAVPLLLLLF